MYKLSSSAKLPEPGNVDKYNPPPASHHSSAFQPQTNCLSTSETQVNQRLHLNQKIGLNCVIEKPILSSSVNIFGSLYIVHMACLVQLRYSLGTRERPFTGVLSRYKRMHGLMDFPSNGGLQRKTQPLDRGVECCPRSLLWPVGRFHRQRKRKASHKREIEGLDSRGCRD